MTDPTDLSIRDARPEVAAGIRDLTLDAYAEYAGTMELTAWTGLREAVERALATTEPGIQRIVAGRLLRRPMAVSSDRTAW